ncbi:pitrilysin family protein [Niabella terrae]
MLLTLTAVAQKQTPPEGGTPKDFKLPAKNTASLPNGMRSVLVPYGAIPKVSIRLIVKTGNVHEGANQIWLSDLLGRLMNEGTRSLSARELAVKAASMGGAVGISVGSDQLTIYGDALAEFAPELTALLADMVMHPLLPVSELPRLKADLKRNLALSKTRPRSIASEQFNKLVFANTPYAVTYPTEAMIDSYTIEDIRHFYEQELGARRAVLYVAGQFDEKATGTAIQNSFKDWKPGKEPLYPSNKQTAQAGVTLINRDNAPQTTIIMGLPSIGPSDPDYLAMTVTNALLGGSFASRITSNIREDKGYTYSPGSGLSLHPTAAAWNETADVTSEHTIDAIREIKKEINLLATEAPGQSELLGIQRYMAGIFVLQNSTPSGIIGQLNFMDLYGLDDSYLNNQVKNIYAVTPGQVSALAKKYLPVDKMTIVMVGDSVSVKKQQEAAEK